MACTEFRRVVTGALLVIMLASAAGPVSAAEISTSARQALLIEYPTMRVLFEKRAKAAMSPSSMTKLMTVFLIFEALRRNDLVPDAPVTVSRRAAGMGGSTIGLQARQTVPLRALLRAAIIASANDATVALAEHVARSEAEFARRMTKRAKELGLARSRFRNATGFTAKGHRMSAADVALLASLIIAKFPEYYPWFAEKSFEFRGRSYANRNPLLGTFAGADGLKTGQTRAAGHGLVASAQRGSVRLILVINGLKSEAERKREATRLMDWGFTQATASK